MKTKHVPALVMLLAGAVASLLMLIWKVDFFHFTRNLLIILIVFYILGCIVRVILDRNFKDMEEEAPEGEEENENEEAEGEPGEYTENVDTEDEETAEEEGQQ